MKYWLAFGVFFAHWLTGVAVLLAGLGAGSAFEWAFLKKSKVHHLDLRTWVRRVILGFGVLYCYSALLVLYVPAQYSYLIFISTWILGLSLLVRLGLQGRLKLQQKGWRSFGLLILLASLSFLMTYLPFAVCTQGFLASEGGGDIVGFLGIVKVYFNRGFSHEVFQPRVFNLMDVSHSYLNETFGATFQPYLNHELAEGVAFRSGLNPTTYSFLYFLSPLQVFFSIETIYMAAALMARALLAPLVVCLIPASLKSRNLLGGLVFTLVCLSAGLHSVFLNHAIYQIYNILFIGAIFLVCIEGLEQQNKNLFNTLILLSTLCWTIVTLYFAALPWAFGLVGLYLGLSIYKNPDFFAQVISSFRKLQAKTVLLVLGGLSLFPCHLETIMRLKAHLNLVMSMMSPAVVQAERDRLGPPVTNLREIIACIQGAVTHHLLPPHTTYSLEKLWAYWLTPLWIVPVFLGLVYAFFVKGRRDVRRSEISFYFLSLVLLLGLVAISKTYSYTFDKAATNSAPFLMVGLVSCVGWAFERWGNRSLAKSWGLAGGVLLLAGLWMGALAQVRFYQIKSFWKKADRVSIVYTDFLKRLPYPKAPSRSFIYAGPGAGTDFFLLDGALTGKWPLPLSQYVHSMGYAKLLQNVNLSGSNFVFPEADGRNIRAVDLSFFNFPGDSGHYAIPMGPFIDVKESQLPHHIKTDRPSSVSFVILSREPLKFICSTPCTGSLTRLDGGTILSSASVEKKSGGLEFIYRPTSGKEEIHLIEVDSVRDIEVRKL